MGGLAVAATMGVAAEAVRSSTTHLEFVSAWFPTDASSAMHADVPAIARLASQMHGEPSHFGSALETLDLIRDHVGFDHSQIERMTTATITVGAQGKVTFFTLLEPVPLDAHFASGPIPLVPSPDLIGGKAVYNLNAGARVLGLYSPAGKHFILGDWGAFKIVLNGNGGEINQISKILEIHSAPIILGANPRRQRKRFAEDAPFGTVVSIDFQGETLAFLMQEEHPTPDHAQQRLAVVEEEMPIIFRDRYGLTTKMGVRYHSFADGRHVVFGGTSAVNDSRKLLETLLGKLVESDPDAIARSNAARAIELFSAARAGGADCSALGSEAAIVEALCAGLGGKVPAGGQFPFLTGVERQRLAAALVLEAGELSLAPEPEIPGPMVTNETERQIQRHARLIATLSSSAAAVDSPQLKKLATVEEIVAAICTTGLGSGPGYEAETFKGPELSSEEVERVAGFLVASHGYLIYREPSEGGQR